MNDSRKKRKKDKKIPLRIPRLFAARDFRNNELHPFLAQVLSPDGSCAETVKKALGRSSADPKTTPA
jgi:hypothetical protein